MLDRCSIDVRWMFDRSSIDIVEALRPVPPIRIACIACIARGEVRESEGEKRKQKIYWSSGVAGVEFEFG